MQFSEERSPHAHIGELLTAEAYAGLGLTADAAEMLERKRDDLRDLLPLDPSLDFYIDRATRALASLAANPSPVH
jgi:hypothetical protein